MKAQFAKYTATAEATADEFLPRGPEIRIDLRSTDPHLTKEDTLVFCPPLAPAVDTRSVYKQMVASGIPLAMADSMIGALQDSIATYLLGLWLQDRRK